MEKQVVKELKDEVLRAMDRGHTKTARAFVQATVRVLKDSKDLTGFEEQAFWLELDQVLANAGIPSKDFWNR